MQLRFDCIDHYESPRLNGSKFIGEHLTIVKLEAQGINQALASNPIPWLTFGILESGSFTGSSGDREILARPQKFAFIALPGESVKLLPKLNSVTGYLFHISADYLIAEAVEHGTQSPSLLSLQETIPGHEELILACSNQLLKCSSLNNELSSSRIIQPLEQSIVSLLATLVGVESNVVLSQSGSGCRPSYVQIALTYMEDNISSAITLSDICVACNVSSRTLQVSFQAVMNQTPLQVLQELRLKKLRSYLSDGLDVGRACDQVGLQQSGRVSAKYKQLYGELPRDTRQRSL